MSPAFSVTIAFFQLARLPTVLPTRRVLAAAVHRLNARDLDAEQPLDRVLICVLFAPDATSNVYSPRSWYATERLLGHDRPHDRAI